MKEIIRHYKILLSCEKFVVTGSYAMNMMGIYNKEAEDLDIILLNPTKETVELLKKLQDESPAETHASGNDAYIFKHEGKKIDVFTTNDIKRVSTELKVDDVFISKASDVIKAKKSYNRMKDWLQLRKMSQMFFKQPEFEEFLNKQY